MTIIDQPLSLSLLGNIKKFKIGSAEKVSFVLKKGSETIIQQTYDPGTSCVVEIDVKDILSGYLSYEFRQTTDAYIQTNIVADFTATISGTDVTFRVIRGGVDALADTPANFLKGNFLTWQPQIKPVTYSSPEFLTYYAVEACSAVLEATMQDNTKQTLTLINMSAGNAYTIPAQYAAISAKLGNALPQYYDIYVKDASGNRLSYIQRYYPAAMQSEEEQWILFENSLGGLDCFHAYGQTDFTGEHTHNIAEIEEISEEYRVDTERKYKKNTGHLNYDERGWLQDFFPSKKKYIYTGSSVRQIVVTESNVTYTDKELPSNFDFTFKYADAKPFLNLIRNENLTTDLEITLPDASSFIIPPRLSDFERLSLDEGVQFPVQSPYAEKWGATTAGTLAEFFKTYLGNNASGGSIGHTHLNKALLDILTFIDGYIKVNGSKINAGYADKAGSIDGLDDKYLSKINEDTAQKILHLLGGATFGPDGFIDSNANAHLKSLILDSFLETPEYRYNRISINVGDKWNSPGGGIIKEVDTINKIITLKLEDGEIGAVAENDICKGIFHSYNLAENATSNSDDSKGNTTFAGFATCYFRVTEILDTANNSRFSYELRPVSENYPVQYNPSAFMNFVGYANFTKLDRQTSNYETRTYTRYLKNLNTWEISQANIAAQFGDLSNLSVHGLNMTGYSAYLNNIYMSGTIQQFELQEPLRMELNSDIGWLIAPGEQMTVSANVFKGWVDVSASAATWSWTRDSGNSMEDAAWNNAHASLTTSGVITYDDLMVDRCLFTVIATFLEGTEVVTAYKTFTI